MRSEETRNVPNRRYTCKNPRGPTEGFRKQFIPQDAGSDGIVRVEQGPQEYAPRLPKMQAPVAPRVGVGHARCVHRDLRTRPPPRQEAPMLCSPTTDSPTTGCSVSQGSSPLPTGWQPTKYTRAPKPAGGFALLPLKALLLPWLAHEQELLTPLALRGYLACIEMRERRCQAPPETMLCYTTEELRRLLGATVRPSAAAAVRQLLCTAGLVTWPDDGQQLTLCPQDCAAPWCDLERYAALRAAIHPTVQQVPLPRRLVTWLAHTGTPGLIATVFGVACRALRYRDHRVIAGGSLVPAWLATTFRVPRRTVAYWLRHLRTLGWLAPVTTPPAHRRAYGPWLAVNLGWAPPPQASPGCTNLAMGTRPERTHRASPYHNLANATPQPCPEPLDTTCSTTVPCSPHGNPLRDTQPLKNHENLDGTCALTQEQPPASADPATRYATLAPDLQARLYRDAEAHLRQQYPADLVIRPVIMAEVYRRLETPQPPGTPGEAAAPLPQSPALLLNAGDTPPHLLAETSPLPVPFQSEPAAPPPPAPALQAITPADLAALPCLQRLWQDAQARGWIGGSEADWLTLVTVAQHALRVGHNPGGLFVAVLRQQAWHLLTQADEDAAHSPLTASERQVLHQLFGRGKEALPRAVVPPLSLDAQCAREALRLCQTARWQEDPFLAVHAADPAWTRGRWDAARAELEQWQLRQQLANAQHQQALARAWDNETPDASASASTEEHET